MGLRAIIVALLGAYLATGCTQLGVVSDGSSISMGRTNRGRLIDPVELPPSGDGFVTPAMWLARGNRFGTREMVQLVAGVARRVGQPGSPLGVADLSPRRGGWTSQHNSHQNGRDVDLLFFMTGADGRAMPPAVMARVDGAGSAVVVAGQPRPRFDVARNWQLVRALLTAPEAEVQYIFVSEALALLMLDHARAQGEPESLVELARSVLMQPGDSAPHDDHLHVRIFCSVDDVAYGCADRGTRTQLKKSQLARLPAPLRVAVTAPMPAMLALVGRW